jgi:hypothetical protein
MTTFTTESKSQLAKLLATENLRIEHQKIKTAKFDPKNRVLYCPIWKNMSGVLYDLLLGHEVGHALYTPAQGWHDAVCDKGRNYKGFLNVVEDARIEKKVKRKYPGIRKSFVEAYNDLMDRDFFELKGRDVNKMSFVNRLNLFTKSSGTMDIQFTAFEEKLVEEVLRCETWDDVLRVTGMVWDYSKEEQFEMQEEEFNFELDSFGDYEFEFDNDSDGESSKDGKSEFQNSKGEKSEDEDGEGSQNSRSMSDDSEEEQDSENDSSVFDRFKESKASSKDMFEPTCETDNAFRKKENELLDETCKEYIYVTLPEPNLKNIITPAKRVHELLSEFYSSTDTNELLNKFKSRNERFVSLLAKEFEMKKAASCYAKAKTSNTGDIDVSKIYKYKFDDTIFKKMMRIPKGKSHGLILLLDKSGSMSNNLKGSIEQILILTSFCRKVNIPFVVYGFGNNTAAWTIDNNVDYAVPPKCFTSKQSEIGMDTVFLREYLNSKMSNSEYTKAMKNMVAYMESFGGYRYARSYPASEALSNTPLVEAIVATEKITQEFRKVNNLDIVNLAIVHDGDADTISNYHLNSDDEKTLGSMNTNYYNVYLRDKNSKFEIKIESREYIIHDVLKWYTHKTGAKVFGFFLTEGSSSSAQNAVMSQYYDEDGKYLYEKNMEWHQKKEIISGLAKTLRKEKLLISNKPGYKNFFIIPGGNELQVDDGEIEIDTTKKVTATKLTNAFLKYTKKRQVNRVLVSKFIDGIAA